MILIQSYYEKQHCKKHLNEESYLTMKRLTVDTMFELEDETLVE